MNALRIRYILYTIIFMLPATSIYSCNKEDKKTEQPPEVKISGAEDVKSFPGLHRIKLSWKVSDGKVKKAVVYNGANRDSIVVPYDGGGSMSVIFPDLEDGNHSFSIYLYDSQGHASSRSKIVARAYGDKYIQTLTSRTVKDAIYEDGQVRIVWNESVQNMLGTEVRYLRNSNDIQYVNIQPETDSSILNDYKPGTYFDYRSKYKPEPEAIDSFYAAYSSSKKWSTFSNPLFTNRGADPWVAYKDGMYYFTYTQGGGITLYATKKMSQLGSATPVEVWRPQSGTNYSKDIWAPELHFINNKWYVYFAGDDGQDAHHRMYVIENSSADPLQKTWEFKGELQEPSNNWAIDGTPLEYNGQLYFIWSGKTNGASTQNLYIAKMSNPYTLEGSRIKISSPDYNWEKNGSPINEGPEILKNKDGDVFLIYSGSGFWTDDYCLGQLQLKDGGDPLNPSDWIKDSKPVFKRNDAAGAYAPGHNGFFISRDGTENWIIYHARSFPNGGSTNYRNPRIQQFTWNQDGTPNFGQPVKINESMTAPSGEF